MRRAVLLAATLVALLVAGQWLRPLLVDVSTGVDPASRPGIIAVSLGKACARATMAEDDLGAKIVYGDYFLSAYRDQPCLLVASLSPDGRIRESRRFDLSTSGPDMAAFIDFCNAQPVDTLLAMAVNASAKLPSSPEFRAGAELVARTLEGLGAQERPTSDDTLSWAFITARRRDGWQPLAEHVSNYKEVRLAFTPGPVSRLGRKQTPTYICENAPRRQIRLLNYTTESFPMCATLKRYSVPASGGIRAEMAEMSPGIDGSSGLTLEGNPSVLWQDIDIGQKPVLTCKVACRADAPTQARSVTFRILVDGRVAAQKTVTPAEHGHAAWENWTLDLAAVAGTRIDLALNATADAPSPGVHALWQDPTLSYKTLPPVPQPAPPSTEYGLIFMGHAYPFNGFDKRRYASYLLPKGFPPEQAAFQFSKRLAAERTESYVDSFYRSISALSADRLVWGGDVLYEVTPDSAAHFHRLATKLNLSRQVWVPGNHDYALLGDESLQRSFHALANSTEFLGNVRLLYVNSVTANGQPTDSGPLSRPSRPWISQFIEAVTESTRGHSVVIFMHHAPWIEEDACANVSHAAIPWWRALVHPALAASVRTSGRQLYVVAGDGGTGCLADARETDGIRYIVSGQPRFDDGVANGFLELRWTAAEPGIRLVVHAWRPESGFERHHPASFPWRY